MLERNGQPLPLKEPLLFVWIAFLGQVVRMRTGLGSFRVRVALFALPWVPFPFRHCHQDRPGLWVFVDLGGG